MEEVEAVLFSLTGDLFSKHKLNPKSIDILITNCSVNSPSPSLAAMLINRFGLRSNVMSFNLSGMGCSAGVLSISLARDLLKVHKNSLVLLLSTESICSNVYQGKVKSMLLANCKCVFMEPDAEGHVGVSLSRSILQVAGEALKTNMSFLGPLVLPFSKRKAGIFKKASELATLCGTDVGIILFSPAGKPYSFGHPSINSVFDKFLDQNQIPNNFTDHFVEAHLRERMHQLNQKLNELQKQLEAEKNKGKLLDQIEKEHQRKGEWKGPIDELSLHELEELKLKMQRLQKNVDNRLGEVRKGASSSSSTIATNPSQAIASFNDGTPQTYTYAAPTRGYQCRNFYK